MICKQCGHDILDDSRFCENCGAKVEVTVTPEFQPIQVTPVYPPNSVYARNAAIAQNAPVMVQQVPVQGQYVPVQQAPVQQQYVPTQIAPYANPAYAQPVAQAGYVPYTEPSGSTKFPIVLRIVSGVGTGIFSLVMLYAMLSGDFDSDKLIALFVVGGFSVFSLVFSLVKKRMGKGSFLRLLIPNIIVIYLMLSFVGS